MPLKFVNNLKPTLSKYIDISACILWILFLVGKASSKKITQWVPTDAEKIKDNLLIPM